MAFTFDATISGTAANSYVLVTEADDYFDGTVEDETWSALSTAVKEQYLVMATTRLESETYGGYAAEVTQRLQHPRLKVITRYADDYLRVQGVYPTDMYYSELAVPKEMQEATFEMALYYINKYSDNLGTIDEIDLEQLTSYAIGPLSVKIKEGFKVERLPAKVARMLTALGPTAWVGGKQTTAIRG